MYNLSKHSNWSKIVILFISLVFINFFFLITKNFSNELYLIPIELSLNTYLVFFLGNFLKGNLILKLFLLVIVSLIFNFLILEIKSSFLDYIHSYIIWIFSTSSVIILFIFLFIKLFFFILLI